jgi:N-formylmaleamate deformylase
VEAGGIKLHYTRTGGGGPPLVLAHGFSDDGLCWTPIARALEAERDVIMVDARGHGRSDGPDEGYDTPSLADDLAGAIAALGLERPPVLGHSMGAATALMLAARHPDAVGAILLEDPPSIWMPPRPDKLTPQQRAAGMRGWVVAIKRKTRDELIAGQRVADPAWPEDELEPWADSKLRLSFNLLNRNYDISADSSAALRQIKCPLLLITGDESRGALVSAEAAEALQSMLPQARVAHIADAGHSIRRDQRARYLEVVRDFLASN